MRNRLFGQALTHRGALYRVDDDIDDQTRVTEIVIEMSSAVTLFENSNAMQAAFDKQHLLRKKIK